MHTPQEKEHFLEQGFLHAPGVLEEPLLQQIRCEFDRVWELESPTGKVNQHKLLQYSLFLGLIEHPAILQRHRAIFGNQIQLLQYDLLRQGPESNHPERSWHRDFSFPGERPVSINTIVYLDDMDEIRGPTRVVPGSHKGTARPPAGQIQQPLDGEIAVYAHPGDAVFINSAIWHSGGCNRSSGLRRGIYLYYGYWWLKRYESDQDLPWQALQGAHQQRLHLLGLKMPDRDLHIYDPEA
ncbi:MAG: hypothetical protein GKR89_33960 [Candidatus Latescibacteria bacterium]|nr:hypothetical protein [Candidatus Latescibacterota bacterium]